VSAFTTLVAVIKSAKANEALKVKKQNTQRAFCCLVNLLNNNHRSSALL
jgi:hypothetical protein